MKKLITLASSLLLALAVTNANADEMNHQNMDHSQHMNHDMSQSGDAMVHAQVEVKAISASKHKIKVKHQEIKAWGWPMMVMTFNVEPSIDLTKLEKGKSYMMMLEKDKDGMVTVTGIMH
ncbi:copper-binding protein (plasmid) [Vibrio sp. SS-MA-C1-2]|uniref:copper-binding protein n=1 Tax=Vibrio sp. SS-MA-C1-2 TaxID=2908646 RepID=UPI001F2B8043|nr:copper-binding protein [Vibrio sp. SS-MA-C1-2]UJF20367.1 copper-binding protein [Vibrio sp. SS-MA-C1-2]